MKALQSNSQWISQPYKQDALDDNWIVGEAHLTQNVTRYGLKPGASTSSITIPTPEGGMVAGTTQLRLANASEVATITAGTVTTTMMTTTSANTTNTGTVNGYHYNATKFLPDGTVFRMRSSTAVIDHYSLSTAGDLLSTHTLIASYPFAYPYNISSAVIFILSADGQYVFMHAVNGSDSYDVIRRYTLNNPFDLTTVDENYEDYDVTSLWINGCIDDTTMGGVGSINFSPDGLKGVLVNRVSGAMSSSINTGGAINFQCTRPFDLSTATANQYRCFYNGWSAGAIEFTPDGNTFYWSLLNVSTNYIRVAAFASSSPFQVPEGFGSPTDIPPTFIAFSESSIGGSSSAFGGAITYAPWGNFLYCNFWSGTSSVRLLYSTLGTNGSTYVSANQSTIDISSAGLSSAPTVVGPPTISPSLAIKSSSTANDFDLDYKSLLIDPTTSASSLVVGSLSIDGSSVLQTGDEVIIDGQQVQVGTVTTSTPYYTAAPTPTTWLAEVQAHDKFISVVDGWSSRIPDVHPHNATLHFSPDGKRLLWGGNSTTAIRYYDVGRPFDISTLTFRKSVNVGSVSVWTPGASGASTDNQLVDMVWSHDGNYAFVIKQTTSGSDNPMLFRYPLDKPFDFPDTAVPDQYFGNSSELRGSAIGLQFIEDGQYLLYMSSDTSYNSMYIKIFSLGTPYDLSTRGTVFTDKNIRVTTGNSFPVSQKFQVIKSSRTGEYWWIGGSNFNGRYILGNVIGDLSKVLQQNFWNGVANNNPALQVVDTNADRATGFFLTPEGNSLIVGMYSSSNSRVNLYQWTAPFIDYETQYTCDISGLGLSGNFKRVEKGESGSFTSLTPDSTTNNANTIVQNYDAIPLNARAVKFAINGAEGAVVNKVELDLST